MRRSDSKSATADSAYASTIFAARILGVGVTTVKRWVDEGILPARRTPGGHRKLLLQDVMQLVRSGSVPNADLSALPPTDDIGAIRKSLAKAVDATDAEAIGAVLAGAYRGGLAIEAIADSLIAPALRHVGECWKRGAIAVMDEHRITRAFTSACYGLEAQIRSPANGVRPIALGGSPEGDHSGLPTLLAKLTLLDAGWDAIDLGPHTPFSAFTEAIDSLKPKLVWLSASHIGDADRFAKDYAKFHRVTAARGIAVVVGGSALTPKVAARMAYSATGKGLAELAAFAKGLHAPATVPVRGRPVGNRKS